MGSLGVGLVRDIWLSGKLYEIHLDCRVDTITPLPG